MTAPIVDLRSDTVTRPTPAMRRAIAEAVVGDDVFGDDPTVLELESRVAALAGKEAALYVPSGTMANQLAVNVLTSPADEVLLETTSHIYYYEQGGIAANSGVLAHPVAGERGALSVEQLLGVLRGPDDHVARVTLVCTENTHNRAGGAIVPIERLRALAAVARERGVRVHLDGARLWNAHVATGVPIADWVATADTAMMCFSKGLGCPVGSALSGTAGFIERARRFRKMFGGGMRQSGLLAAAALHALDHHVERLAVDHANARALAEGVAGIAGLRPIVEPARTPTNMVFFDVDPAACTGPALCTRLEGLGVRMIALDPQRVRAVTHLDVDSTGIARAVAALRQAMKG